MANQGILTIKPPTGVVSSTPSTRSPNGIAQGWWNPSALASTDAAILNGLITELNFISTSSPAVTTAILQFNWDAITPIFSLDGAPYVAFSALPPGFFMNGIIELFAEWTNGPTGPYSAVINGNTISQGVGVAFTFNELNDSGLPLTDFGLTSYITPSNFLSSIFELTLHGTNLSSLILVRLVNGFTVTPFTFTGKYFIYQYDWTISLPGGSPVHVGDRIILTANMHGGNLGYHDFTDVTRIQFSYPIGGITRIIEVWKNGSVYEAYGGDDAIDLGGYPVSYINDPSTAPDPPQFTNDYGPYVINWEPETITITIPFGFGDYGGPITVAGHVDEPPVDDPDNPIPFTGSVPLAPITISFADTSGIYNITRGKKTDTLYNLARDGTTVEVAIPKPFAKTGFING